MNNVVNIVVWGLGRHALNRILPAVQLCESLNLYGVCTRNAEVLTKTSNHYQCRAFSDELEMLSDDDVDVVYLATPIGLHYEQGKSIIMANKHLWCEKPLVNKLAHAIELVKLASNKNVSLFEAFMYLHHPQYQFIKKFVSQNISNLATIESRFTIPELENPGFRHDSSLGGSVLYDIGSYPLSLLLELIDEEDIKINYCSLKYDNQLNIDVSGNAVIESKNGIRIHLDWGMGLAYENSVNIYTNDGKLYADKIFSKPEGYIAAVNVYDKYGNQVQQPSFKANQFVLMLDKFTKIIENKLAIDIEYNKILKRAKILEKITQH